MRDWAVLHLNLVTPLDYRWVFVPSVQNLRRRQAPQALGLLSGPGRSRAPHHIFAFPLSSYSIPCFLLLFSPPIILDPGAYDACLQLPPCFEAPFSKVSGVRVPPSCWNWWQLVMPSWQQVWRLIGLSVSPSGPDSRRDLSGEWITPGPV